jgi:hypothetical protein
VSAAAEARTDRLEPGFVRLEASAPSAADPAVVAALLAGPPDRWLGEAEPRGVVEGFRRYAVDLRLGVGTEGAPLLTLRKAAFVDLGAVQRRGPGYEVEIGWRAASAAPLFPVFSGRLVVGRDLQLDGIYAPPGGAAGRIADRVLLHTAANATARWILGRLAEAARDAAPTD